MGLLDRIAAIFRQQQNAPAVTTADVAGLRRGAEPLDFAASLQADSERRTTVKTCREMYKKDPRARGIIKALARDMTRGGFTVTVKNNRKAEQAAADLSKRLDLDGILDDWVRLTLRDGDTFLELGVDGGQHIALATRKPPLQMHRNSDAADRFPDPARAYWLAPETWYGGSEPPADAEWFADWQIIHARWDHDAEERYGVPLFAAATSAYKRIKEGETDIAVRRKTRSGVKYNHKFPEGTTADQIEAYKEANQDNLADPTAAIADFFGTADIQVVAGEGGALEAIGDVMHHVRTWWLASPLPMSLLGYGQDLNRDVLDKQSEQYQRALESLTQWVEAQFVKPLLEREWLLAGILPDSLKYEIKWKTTELLTIATVTAAADAVAKLTAAGMPKLAAWEMVERFLPGVDLTQAKAEMQQAAEDAKAQFAGQSAQPPTKRDNPPTNEPPKPGQPEPPVTAQEAVILGEVVAEYQRAAKMFGQVLAEFNPNHDQLGRFASTGSTYTRQDILDHIMQTNAPEQVKQGMMTPEQWADKFLSDEPHGYELMKVDPRTLNLPISAGSPDKVASYAAQHGASAPPIVVDSNEKIEARFGGGKLDQAYGRQPHTVVDGKHRVEAALQRGDTEIQAFVPKQHVDKLRTVSHELEAEDFMVAYIQRKGYTIVGRTGHGWLVSDPKRGQVSYTMRDVERIAKNTGHEWKYLTPEKTTESAGIVDDHLLEFNPYHDRGTGQFASAGAGGGGMTPALSKPAPKASAQPPADVRLTQHAFERMRERGKYASVNATLSKLMGQRTPPGDWYCPMQQGGKLAGYLVGTDGVVKTVLGPWYNTAKLRGEVVTVTEAQADTSQPSVRRSIEWQLSHLSPALVAAFCEIAGQPAQSVRAFRETWADWTPEGLECLLIARSEVEDAEPPDAAE